MTQLLLAIVIAQSPRLAPDSVPGAINTKAVSQGTIHQTICRQGWTQEVRPSRYWSQAYKRKLLSDAGLPGSAAHLFELDHRIPLELGGDALSSKNLWLQPLENPGAIEKDQLENYVRRRVCAGSMTLREGQAVFFGDWWQSYRKFGLGGARR